MSPAPFKEQMARLGAELSKCIQFCEDIRVSRRIGSAHDNLDRLQLALESAEISIPDTYSDIRQRTGSRMDTGDEKARGEMNEHILEVQSTIKVRLHEVAHPSRHRTRHEKELAGFADLHRQWKIVHRDITETMHSLSRRITTTAVPGPPKSILKPSPPPYRPSSIHAASGDNITISVKEFHQYLAHMRNSWEEVIVNGTILYVNLLDREKKTSERPSATAYIKPSPRLVSRSGRVPTWETTVRTPSRERYYRRSFKVPEWETRAW